MKQNTTLVALACLIASTATAQLNVGGTPYGIRMGLDRAIVPTMKAAAFDAAAAAADDAVRAANGQIPLYSRFVALNASPASSGLWQELPNGDRLWRLRIESIGALATELFFEDFYLPVNAQLYLYDDDGGQVLGGFTSVNNRPSGLFATAMMMGEACVIEYYEPQSAMGQGHFNIPHVGHAYRMVGDAKADDCEVDVNCDPEGSNWWQQRDGVVRLLVVEPGGSGYCSGSVVNNVEQDCTPYILTAFHCGVSSTTANFAQWKAYFRYQRSGCETGTALLNKVLTGCVKRGDSNDGGGNTGSDFLLIELDDPIPDNFTPYFNGWSAVNTASPNGVGIHHPAGDEKKISTYTATTTTSGWGVSNTHWRVFWSGTSNGWGVTEGGSSGSPLFNNNGLIIGTLTGGGSYCNSVVPGGQTQPDYYGKMSYHWNDNPGAASEHLEEWLDPNGTGVTTLAGSYDPCGTYSIYNGLAEFQEQEAPEAYPNPVNDLLTVLYPDGVERADRIDLIDVTGRTTLSIVPSTLGQAAIDVRGLSEGSYLVRLVADGAVHAATRVSVTGR